jgi:hypothetical protein
VEGKTVLLCIGPRDTQRNKKPSQHTQTLMAVLFIIGKSLEQPICLAVDKWINRMWYTHMMEHYLAIKRNEVLTHTY